MLDGVCQLVSSNATRLFPTMAQGSHDLHAAHCRRNHLGCFNQLPLAISTTLGVFYAVALLCPTLALGQENELPSRFSAEGSPAEHSLSPEQSTDYGESAAIKSENEAPAKKWRSYAWQTLAADGIGVGLVLMGASMESPAIVLFGLSSFLLTTPSIHLAHTNYWTSAGSFGIRAASIGFLAASVVVGLGSLCFDSDEENPCDDGGEGTAEILAITSITTAVGAIVFDAVMARDEYPESSHTLSLWADPRRRSVGLAVTVPTL